MSIKHFDPTKHPRSPKGSSKGGKFASKSGAAAIEPTKIKVAVNELNKWHVSKDEVTPEKPIWMKVRMFKGPDKIHGYSTKKFTSYEDMVNWYASNADDIWSVVNVFNQ